MPSIMPEMLISRNTGKAVIVLPSRVCIHAPSSVPDPSGRRRDGRAGPSGRARQRTVAVTIPGALKLSSEIFQIRRPSGGKPHPRQVWPRVSPTEAKPQVRLGADTPPLSGTGRSSSRFDDMLGLSLGLAWTPPPDQPPARLSPLAGSD